jgi:hypothetical protein
VNHCDRYAAAVFQPKRCRSERTARIMPASICSAMSRCLFANLRARSAVISTEMFNRSRGPRQQ